MAPKAGVRPTVRLGTFSEYAIDAVRGLGYLVIDLGFLACVGALNYVMDVYVWDTLATNVEHRDVSIIILETIFTVGTVGYALLRMLRSLAIEAFRYGLIPRRLHPSIEQLISPGFPADTTYKP